MASILAFIGILALCGLMLWGSYKLQPHWASRDGERVICYGHGVGQHGESYGRWREVKVASLGNGLVELRQRRGTIADERQFGTAGIGGMMGRTRGSVRKRPDGSSQWKVNGALERSARRVTYLLENDSDPTLPEMFAIRLPSKSRAIPVLEALATNKAPSRIGPDEDSQSAVSSSPSRERPQSAEPPDPG